MLSDYSISVAAQCLMFAYWVIIATYFYQKDTKQRHDQQIQATIKEIQLSQSNGDTIHNFSGFKQWQFRASIWYSSLQILAMFFNFKFNELKFSKASQFIANITAIDILRLDIPDFAYYSIFGTLAFLYSFFIFHTYALHKYLPKTFNEYFDKLQGILFEFLLIPSLSTFNAMLICTKDDNDNDNKAHVNDLELEWFGFAHFILLSIAVLMLCLISFFALYSNQNFHSSQFVFMERFITVWIILQILLAGIKCFFIEYVHVVIAVIIILSIYMEYVVWKHQPCLGRSKVFNGHFAAVYAVFIYGGIASFVILFLTEFVYEEGMSEIIFFIGMPFVIILAWKQSNKRQKAMDNALLLRCERIFDDGLNINERIKIAKDALVLSMTTDGIDEYMNIFFGKYTDKLTMILRKNKDFQFSILLIQCITNFAVFSKANRLKIIGTNNFIRMLLRYVKSSQQSTVTNEFPRAVMALLCNVCFESEFKPFVTKKVLLDFVTNIESGSDANLRDHSIQIIMMLIGLKDKINAAKQNEIKEYILKTDKIFSHIWWLIVNETNDDRLRTKALNLIYHLCDSRNNVESLQRNKLFDIRVIQRINSKISKKIITKMNKYGHIPKAVEIDLKSANKSCPNLLKDVDRSSSFKRLITRSFTNVIPSLFSDLSKKLENDNSIKKHSSLSVFIDPNAAKLSSSVKTKIRVAAKIKKLSKNKK